MAIPVSVSPGTYTRQQFAAIYPEANMAWPPDATTVTFQAGTQVPRFGVTPVAPVGPDVKVLASGVTSAEAERALAASHIPGSSLRPEIHPFQAPPEISLEERERALAGQYRRPVPPRPAGVGLPTTPPPMPTPPRPLPPAVGVAPIPPLPNLVRNQAAVNQALTKLAQADALANRAETLGMNVNSIRLQITELRNLLQLAQQHLMS
jgi:hypothetical protein